MILKEEAFDRVHRAQSTDMYKYMHFSGRSKVPTYVVCKIHTDSSPSDSQHSSATTSLHLVHERTIINNSTVVQPSMHQRLMSIWSMVDCNQHIAQSPPYSLRTA